MQGLLKVAQLSIGSRQNQQKKQHCANWSKKKSHQIGKVLCKLADAAQLSASESLLLSFPISSRYHWNRPIDCCSVDKSAHRHLQKEVTSLQQQQMQQQQQHHTITTHIDQLGCFCSVNTHQTAHSTHITTEHWVIDTSRNSSSLPTSQPASQPADTSDTTLWRQKRTLPSVYYHPSYPH